MLKFLIATGMMALVAGCAASAEDATASLTSAVSKTDGTSNAAEAEATDGGHGGHHRGPPPEAFTACEGKAADEVCTVTTPRGDSLAGKCVSPPADAPDTRLHCRPDNMPEGPPPVGGRGEGGGRGGADCDKPGSDKAAETTGEDATEPS